MNWVKVSSDNIGLLKEGDKVAETDNPNVQNTYSISDIFGSNDEFLLSGYGEKKIARDRLLNDWYYLSEPPNNDELNNILGQIPE